MYEGQYDDRISPLIEDARAEHWMLIWWFLLRQYATGLVFGTLVTMPTCEHQVRSHEFLLHLWQIYIVAARNVRI